MKATASPKRIAAYERGLQAEEDAARYLIDLGWDVVARRHKVKGGEVDIVARRDDTVLFVEVKARASVTSALDSISRAAQRRIETAGEAWIAAQEDGALLSWRMDVIAIVPGHPPFHFENVW